MKTATVTTLKVTEFKSTANYAAIVDGKELVLFDSLAEMTRFLVQLGYAKRDSESVMFTLSLKHLSDNERAWVDGYYHSVEANKKGG